MTAPQAPRDGAAVEFHGVAFSYADAEGNLFEPVLKGVSLSVARGQCVVVTGCSGCGKTTLMRLVNGLVPQAYDGELSGTVCVLGQDAADLGIEGLSLRVGSVFQNPRSQFFNLDTTSEIAFGCENAGLPHDEIRLRVRSAAADLGISHLLDRDIRELSGGQRQMVAIASVHALGPEVFALDEPTAALDVASMRTLAHLVRRLKELGRTVIVSEHRLWWLRGIADRVVHMEDGRIAHDWAAAEFERLPVRELHRMGLRAWRIEDACAEGAPTDGQDPSLPCPVRAVSAAARSATCVRATVAVTMCCAGPPVRSRPGASRLWWEATAQESRRLRAAWPGCIANVRGRWRSRDDRLRVANGPARCSWLCRSPVTNCSPIRPHASWKLLRLVVSAAARRPGRRLARHSTVSASRIWPSGTRCRSRAASASDWPLRPACCRGPACWCWTSPRAGLTSATCRPWPESFRVCATTARAWR